MAFSEGSGDGGGKSFIRDQTADPGTWSQSQSVEMPSSPSRSPIPKVIGRGRGVALRSISSPVKRPISPHNMEGEALCVWCVVCEGARSGMMANELITGWMPCEQEPLHLWVKVTATLPWGSSRGAGPI